MLLRELLAELEELEKTINEAPDYLKLGLLKRRYRLLMKMSRLCDELDKEDPGPQRRESHDSRKEDNH